MSRRDAEVFVFTFKEGALSALAHDLKIAVTRLELDATEDTVTATFDAHALKVVCPRKDGRDNPGVLPTMLYGEIEKNIVKDVLESSKFPQVKFQSTKVSADEVIGQLTLLGVTREIRCKRSADGTVEARLDVRDFRIKPYSAMFGTLKVKPEVVVSVRLKS
jgi:hypothetical protein